jgi:magnesium-transporting ATPase (P-type)
MNKLESYENQSSEKSSSQNQINAFNDEYTKYEKLNYSKDPRHKEFKNEIEPSIHNEVIETRNILQREYTFLLIWFIIAIIFFTFTIIGIISNELNSYVLYLSLGFLIFIMFYIIKNIFIYFNEL